MNRGSHPVLGGALAAVAAAIARALSLPSCGAWLTAQPGAAAPGLRRRRASWPAGAPARFTSCRDMAARAGDPLTACRRALTIGGAPWAQRGQMTEPHAGLERAARAAFGPGDHSAA